MTDTINVDVDGNMTFDGPVENPTPANTYRHVMELNVKVDEILEFINALKQGMGNAQNSGGPMAMMARAMLPDFSQG